MGVNFAKLNWVRHRILRRRTLGLHEVAAREWVISPAETRASRPAVFPRGTLERIKALSPWRSMAAEMALIEGRPVEHAATLAHQVGNVHLAGSFLYCGSARLRAGAGAERFFGPNYGGGQVIPAACLAASWTGADFFGNFLLDSFPLELIPQAGERTLGAPTKPFGHSDGYRELCGLPQPEIVPYASVRQLTFYTDFAQNAFKEARYRTLRGRLRQAIGPGKVEPRPGVYLRRGATGEARILMNEGEVEEILASLGFDVLDAMRLGAREISKRMLDARIIVSVEGSHLSHGIFSVADGGAFLVIQPPHRFAMPYKEFTDRMDMRFGFVVGTPTEGGFTVDTTEILRVIERL